MFTGPASLAHFLDMNEPLLPHPGWVGRQLNSLENADGYWFFHKAE